MRGRSSLSLDEVLCNAAKINDIDTLNSLITPSKEFVYTQKRRTPLHYGAANGHSKVVHFLFQKGYSVNDEDVDGITPLHLAAGKGHKEVVQLLIDLHADLDAKDTADGACALHLAAFRGFSQTVMILCSSGASVNITNKLLFTPLHLTAQHGHNQCSRILISHGADPNFPNTFGDTILHTAARYGHLKVFQMLISNPRISVNAVNRSGDTPLHIATSLNRPQMAGQLLTRGANPHMENKTGDTALEISRRKQHSEIYLLMRNKSKTMGQAESLYALLENASSPQQSSGTPNQENPDDTLDHVDSVSTINPARASFNLQRPQAIRGEGYSFDGLDRLDGAAVGRGGNLQYGPGDGRVPANCLQSPRLPTPTMLPQQQGCYNSGLTPQLHDMPMSPSKIPQIQITEKDAKKKSGGFKSVVKAFFKRMGKKEKLKESPTNNGRYDINPMLAHFLQPVSNGIDQMGVPFQLYRDLAGNVKRGPMAYPCNYPLPNTNCPGCMHTHGFKNSVDFSGPQLIPSYRPYQGYPFDQQVPMNLPCQDHGYTEYHGRFDHPNNTAELSLNPRQNLLNHQMSSYPQDTAAGGGPQMTVGTTGAIVTKMVRSRSDESLAMSESKMKMRAQRAHQWSQLTSHGQSQNQFSGGPALEKLAPVVGRKCLPVPKNSPKLKSHSKEPVAPASPQTLGTFDLSSRLRTNLNTSRLMAPQQNQPGNSASSSCDIDTIGGVSGNNNLDAMSSKQLIVSCNINPHDTCV